MLVFTRRKDEAIIIGDGIEVRVLRVGKDGVRLGITAAPHVPVHRREVYDQIRAANAQAAADASSVTELLAKLREATGQAAFGPAPGAGRASGDD
ncbi:MAG: carbon storage regulator [Vicinamibacterales bacterium]